MAECTSCETEGEGPLESYDETHSKDSEKDRYYCTSDDCAVIYFYS